MDSYKIPSSPETRGANLISSLLLVQSSMTFAFIFMVSVGFFLVKGFFYTRRKNRDQKEPDNQSTNSNEIRKQDLLLDGLRNSSQFVFESFGYNKYITIALYIFRFTVCCWIIGTIISYPFMRKYETDNVLLKSSTYFTHHMVMVFTTYFSSQSLFGMFYLIVFRDFSVNFTSESISVLKRRNKWLVIVLRALSGIIWIVGELNLVASLVVSIGYWFARLGEEEDGVDYISVAYHGVTGILSLIDFLLSNFQYRKWHVFTIMCFPSAYFVWMLTCMRNRLVSEFPYTVLNFYVKPWFAVILVLFGIYLVLGLSFMCASLVSSLRNRLLLKYLLHKENSKEEIAKSETVQQPDSASGSEISQKSSTIGEVLHQANDVCEISISVSMIEMTEFSSSEESSVNKTRTEISQ